MNTVKLVFSAMTAVVVAFFVMATTIDQPFEEKRADCIISASSGDVKKVEISRDGSGNLSFSGDILPETQNKIRLCGLYDDAHRRVVRQFIGEEAWKKVFIVIYGLLAVAILSNSLWVDFVYSKDEQVREKKKGNSKKKSK